MNCLVYLRWRPFHLFSQFDHSFFILKWKTKEIKDIPFNELVLLSSPLSGAIGGWPAYNPPQEKKENQLFLNGLRCSARNETIQIEFDLFSLFIAEHYGAAALITHHKRENQTQFSFIHSLGLHALSFQSTQQFISHSQREMKWS